MPRKRSKPIDLSEVEWQKCKYPPCERLTPVPLDYCSSEHKRKHEQAKPPRKNKDLVEDFGFPKVQTSLRLGEEEKGI